MAKVDGLQHAYASATNGNLNTQRATGITPMEGQKSGDDGAYLAALSTNVSVYVNGERVGFMQDLSPSESRTITPIQELGTEGVVQMVAANTNGGTLSCSRFAVYNANLFNALGLTGTGKFMPGSANDNDKYYPNRDNTYRTYHNVFKSLKDNRVPIEVMVQLNQPGEGSKPKYETYIDCWLTNYGRTISSSQITISETCTISYSDLI